MAACPGSLGFQYAPSDGMGGSMVTIGCAAATDVLVANCRACHLSPPLAASYTSLDLVGADPGPRLVGVAADAANASTDECTGQGNILNKGTPPATGILIDKIMGTQTCGSPMPMGATLKADDLACLQAWANELVQNAGPN